MEKGLALRPGPESQDIQAIGTCTMQRSRYIPCAPDISRVDKPVATKSCQLFLAVKLDTVHGALQSTDQQQSYGLR